MWLWPHAVHSERHGQDAQKQGDITKILNDVSIPWMTLIYNIIKRENNYHAPLVKYAKMVFQLDLEFDYHIGCKASTVNDSMVICP